VKQDEAALARFLADDLQYAHAGGQTQNEAEYIASVTRGPARYDSFTFSVLTIPIYGKVAVLTAFCDVKMVGARASVRAPYRFTPTTAGSGKWRRTSLPG
jgi:hypothetical protein